MNRTILCGALLGAAFSTPVAWGESALASNSSQTLPERPGQADRAHSGAARDPLDTRAPMPALNPRSSLSSYRAYRDSDVGPWRQVNDKVGQIGGWKTYARQSQEPDGAVETSTPEEVSVQPSQNPASGAHAGHGH